jgi:(4S)-4-hydroxy-5-phosphonooxypentane-2,3-dione isomerase
MSRIFLHVVINVRPGKYQDFVTQLKNQITGIRNESGCEYIEIFQNDEQAEVVHVYETWSDRAAWDAHLSNETSKSWQSIAGNFVFSETISILRNL